MNHHTAPTSLVYGLREALHLLQREGLEGSWARHCRVGEALRAGLAAMGLEVEGEPPYAVVRLPTDLDESKARRELLELFGVRVRRIAPHTWGIGLVGADAENPHRCRIGRRSSDAEQDTHRHEASQR